jgi:hypothetical protein
VLAESLGGFVETACGPHSHSFSTRFGRMPFLFPRTCANHRTIKHLLEVDEVVTHVPVNVADVESSDQVFIVSHNPYH